MYILADKKNCRHQDFYRNRDDFGFFIYKKFLFFNVKCFIFNKIICEMYILADMKLNIRKSRFI